jgi:hypothetical protein
MQVIQVQAVQGSYGDATTYIYTAFFIRDWTSGRHHGTPA